MARYERIIAIKDVPFARIIWDYQNEFTGRDIYVSDRMYIALLKFLGFTHDWASDVIKNIDTETRIRRSYRVPDYLAYAIERKGVTNVL